MAVTPEIADYINRCIDARLAGAEDTIVRAIKVGLQTHDDRPVIERQGLEIAYGTIKAVGPVEVSVTLDADPTSLVAMFTVGNVTVGERVLALLIPPSSGIVLGALGGISNALVIQTTAGQVAAALEIQDPIGNDLLTITPAGSITMVEQGSAPPVPAANGVVLYAVDNGSGRTQLFAQFATGAPQLVAIQP